VNRRWLSTAGWGLACALGLLACKGTTNTNPPPPPMGNGGFIIPTGNAGSGGASGMVVVSIDVPTGSLVVDSGSLIDVKATARIDQGTDFIDPTSVEATITAMGDTTVLDSTKLAPGGSDVFSGRISVGDHPSGTYTLRVTASSSGGLKGSAMFDFGIDAGPTLVVRSPQPLQSVKGLLVIDVFADPGMFGPLVDGHPNATVANYPVMLDQVTDAGGNAVPNSYRGMIDLHDPVPGTIVPPLVADQLLTVWAIDARGKRVDIHLVFFVDEQGPQITMTTPVPGEIVGNIIRIAASVSDPAGVLDSSVIAVIGDDTHPAVFNVQLKPDGLGVYSVLFDTHKLTQCPDPPSVSQLCIVFPTISFRASDELGNESAVGYDFSVDNIAPVADLDPPNLRSFKLDQAGFRCSWEFDPLGNDTFLGDMPNDKTMVPQVFDLRARIQDDGNNANGLKLGPIATVDADKTAVYVLDDENGVLIVDTDGDGWCDSINPTLVPTTQPPAENNQVLKVRLEPVSPIGTADFTPDPSLPNPPGNAFCFRGLDPTRPGPLCTLLQPTIAIGYAFNQPAIWSVEPIDKAHCFGNQFDALANNIHEGWACIAVGTADFAGNFSVSPPLRVNIQYKFGGPFGQTGPGTPPECTGIYDPKAGTVSKGACKTRRFERQPDLRDYYCFGTECPGPFVPL
jgi:hypothetical protein